VSIHLIVDDMTDVNYVTVMGEEAEQVAEHVCAALPSFSIAEIVRLLEQATTRDEQIYALYRAGVTLPGQYDAMYMPLFEKTLANDDPDVRRATIIAMAALEWPELQPLMERIAVTDPEADVRADAQQWLDGFAQLHGTVSMTA